MLRPVLRLAQIALEMLKFGQALGLFVEPCRHVSSHRGHQSKRMHQGQRQMYPNDHRPLRQLRQGLCMACQIPKDAGQDLHQPRLACTIYRTDLEAVIPG